MDNKRLEDLLKIASKVEAYKPLDSSKAFNDFAKMHRIDVSQKSPSSNIRSLIIRWSAVAACLCMLFYVGHKMDNNLNSFNSFTANDNNTVIELPDGSKATIEKDAKLFYPESFANLDTRHILLEGNGTFDVAHMPEKPFVVEYDDFNVNVLGTIFNVTKVSDEKTKIANIEGKVKVVDKQDENNYRVLNEGEFIFFSKKSFDTGIEVIPPVSLDNTRNHSIYSVYEHLYNNSAGKIHLHNNAIVDGKAVVRIDLSQSLEEIMRDLDKKTNILYDKEDCNNCYIIYQLKAKG